MAWRTSNVALRQRTENGIEPGARLAGLELGRGLIHHDPPLRDDDDTGTDRLHLFKDVGRENDRLFGRHVFDERADLILLIRIETVRRFIEHQHGRIVQQRLREPHPLFVSLREGLDCLLSHRIEVGKPDGAIDLARACFRAAEAAGFGDEAKKLIHRHFTVGRGAFRQVADPSFDGDGVLGHVVAVDDGRAGRGLKEAGDHLHRGRLARSIGSEEPKDFTAFHGEGDAVDSAFRTVQFDQAFDFNHGGREEVNGTRGVDFREPSPRQEAMG